MVTIVTTVRAKTIRRTTAMADLLAEPDTSVAPAPTPRKPDRSPSGVLRLQNAASAVPHARAPERATCGCASKDHVVGDRLNRRTASCGDGEVHSRDRRTSGN